MKIFYVGLHELYHTADKVYVNGLRENGVTVIDCFSTQRGLRRYRQIITSYWHNRSYLDFIIVGYANPQLVVLFRLLTLKKIIYNAVSSQYERMIISRGLARSFSLKAFYYWLGDFMASHLAWLILLESQHQVDYFCRLFQTSKRKCVRAWTGVDCKLFYYDQKIAKFSKFTVIFRGRLLPESGAEVVIAAAKKLESQNVSFIMVANGFWLKKIQAQIDQLQPANLTLITEYLSDDKLRTAMQQCQLSLGQLSNHQRVIQTVPHKAYESLALKLPYLTARNPAVMELLNEGETCLACNPADADDLAKKIIWAKDHPDQLSQIAAQGYDLYRRALTEKKLAANLLEKIAAM